MEGQKNRSQRFLDAVEAIVAEDFDRVRLLFAELLEEDCFDEAAAVLMSTWMPDSQMPLLSHAQMVAVSERAFAALCPRAAVTFLETAGTVVEPECLSRVGHLCFNQGLLAMARFCAWQLEGLPNLITWDNDVAARQPGRMDLIRQGNEAWALGDRATAQICFQQADFRPGTDLVSATYLHD